VQELTIIRPDDWHVHLRQDGDLTATVRETARAFGRALVMPNTRPPILTADDAHGYRRSIGRAQGDLADGIAPIMTIQIVGTTTPETVRDARDAGVKAGKLYPAGVTTNSGNGVTDLEASFPAFAAMEASGMVLCVHGELPGTFCLDREKAFLTPLIRLAKAFPKLKIVLEHVSTEIGVRAVKELLPETVGATITAHHLLLTLDDVIGDQLEPHHFCKPIPKRPEDRKALIDAATGGDPKFFFGSDSAPHVKGAKECASGCAGIFSAPVALPTLVEVFEREGKLDRLEAFVSVHGARFYGLPPNQDTITLRKEPWTVPERIDKRFVPFRAGQTLSWNIG